MLALAWCFRVPRADGWSGSHDRCWIRPLLCVSSAYWGWCGVDAGQHERCVAGFGRGGMDARALRGGHERERGKLQLQTADQGPMTGRWDRPPLCLSITGSGWGWLDAGQRKRCRLGEGWRVCRTAWGGHGRTAWRGHGRERVGGLHVQIACAGLSHFFASASQAGGGVGWMQDSMGRACPATYIN